MKLSLSTHLATIGTSNTYSMLKRLFAALYSFTNTCYQYIADKLKGSKHQAYNDDDNDCESMIHNHGADTARSTNLDIQMEAISTQYRSDILSDKLMLFSFKQHQALPENNDNFQMRDLTINDISCAITLDQQCYLANLLWSENKWHKIINDKTTIFKKGIFSEDSNQIIANLIVSNKKAYEILIETLTVAPDYRRKGLATNLLRALAECLECNDCNFSEYNIKLTVDNTNHSALKLYEKLGFIEYNRKKDRIQMQQSVTVFLAIQQEQIARLKLI